MDIGYGYNVGIHGIKYGLFGVDHVTLYKLIYGMTSLKYNMFPTIKQLIKNIGRTPSNLTV